MGIRFFCPKGHKLNVKSFLGGKTGFCPYCNARVDIPLTSSWESSHTKKSAGGQAEDEAVDDISLAQPAPVAQPVKQVRGDVPVAMPVASPATGTSDQPVGQQTGPQNPGGPQPAIASPVQKDLPKLTTQPTPAPVAQPPAGSITDPISEAPNAVWYVRPEAGGQYGPATAEVMRQWLDEGRVAADSLVWREGWSDWRPVATTFPELRR